MSYQPSLMPTLPGELDRLVLQYGWQAVYSEVLRCQPGPVRPVPSAPARPTDPETSQMAGPRERDVRRFSDRSRQAKLLRSFAITNLTDQQATIRVVGIHASPSAFEGCRRRCSDLRAAGLLYDTGRRRKNAGSEDESVVWGITDVGRQAIRNLDRAGWSQ